MKHANRSASTTNPAALLRQVPVEQIQRELERRRKGLTALLKKREELAKQLAKLDAEIEALGGESLAKGGEGKKKGGRGTNLSTLILSMIEKGGANGCPTNAIRKAALKAGSTSASLGAALNRLKREGKILSPERGRWVLVEGSTAKTKSSEKGEKKKGGNTSESGKAPSE